MEAARELLRRCAQECVAGIAAVLQGEEGYLAAHALAVSGPAEQETLLKKYRDSLHKVRCTRGMPGQLH